MNSFVLPALKKSQDEIHIHPLLLPTNAHLYCWQKGTQKTIMIDDTFTGNHCHFLLPTLHRCGARGLICDPDSLLVHKRKAF